jgi:hypothetical protein
MVSPCSPPPPDHHHPRCPRPTHHGNRPLLTRHTLRRGCRAHPYAPPGQWDDELGEERPESNAGSEGGEDGDGAAEDSNGESEDESAIIVERHACGEGTLRTVSIALAPAPTGKGSKARKTGKTSAKMQKFGTCTMPPSPHPTVTTTHHGDPPTTAHTHRVRPPLPPTSVYARIGMAY